jgi:hypothetical protein
MTIAPLGVVSVTVAFVRREGRRLAGGGSAAAKAAEEALDEAPGLADDAGDPTARDEG